MLNKDGLLKVLFACGVSLIAVYSLPVSAGAVFKPENIKTEAMTGSNIKRSGLDTPTPVIVIDRVQLDTTSNTFLTDYLFDLPSTRPEKSLSTSSLTVFTPGIASVDLRGLGALRTLILVDGRRHVGGDPFNPNVVNLNSIPYDLVDRIEVVTGGASAVYGSEAMAGVINIITKQDLKGINLNVQSGVSHQSDGEETAVAVSGGTSLSNHSGHVMFHMSYHNLQDIKTKDRFFSERDEIFGDFDAFSPFNAQGSIEAPFGLVTQPSGGGNWDKPFVAEEDGLNTADFRTLQLPLERWSLGLSLNNQLTDNVGYMIKASHIEAHAVNEFSPVGAGGGSPGGQLVVNTLPGNNPFIPSSIKDAWVEAGGSVPDELLFYKTLSQLGDYRAKQSNMTSTIMLGLEGEWQNWYWESYYQWGRSGIDHATVNDLNNLRFQQALMVEPDPDNPGAFRCEDSLARSMGCVPINIFGNNSLSDQAIHYVSAKARDKTTIEQKVVKFSIAGEISSLNPAGSIGLAAGIEYRQESFDSNIDNAREQGVISGFQFSSVSGDYETAEAFIETDIPLATEKKGIHYLGINGAYRYAYYDSIGSLNQWKLGAEWAPNDEVRLRMSRSKSVRAPNLIELFQFQSNILSLSDPCLGFEAVDATTEKNCSAFNLDDVELDGVESGGAGLPSLVNGILSSSPDLQEETADTATLGVVYTPDKLGKLEGLSVTLDYFKIEIDQTIGVEDPQAIISNCYRAEDFPVNPDCQRIIRNQVPDQRNTIKRLFFNYNNLGTLKTYGVDMELRYDFTLLSGNIGIYGLLGWSGDWEHKFSGEVDNRDGIPGYQEWKANSRLSYSRGPWSFAYTNRYVGKARLNVTAEAWPFDRDVNPQWYHDLNVRYMIEGETSYELYLGVNNLTDNHPPYIPAPTGIADPGTGTEPGVYDIVGRFFYLGAEVQF